MKRIAVPSIEQVLYASIDAPFIAGGKDLLKKNNRITFTYDFYPRYGTWFSTTDTWKWEKNEIALVSSATIDPYLEELKKNRKASRFRQVRTGQVIEFSPHRAAAFLNLADALWNSQSRYESLEYY